VDNGAEMKIGRVNMAAPMTFPSNKQQQIYTSRTAVFPSKIKMTAMPCLMRVVLYYPSGFTPIQHPKII
jgi:hypothetical protein